MERNENLDWKPLPSVDFRIILVIKYRNNRRMLFKSGWSVFTDHFWKREMREVLFSFFGAKFWLRIKLNHKFFSYLPCRHLSKKNQFNTMRFILELRAHRVWKIWVTRLSLHSSQFHRNKIYNPKRCPLWKSLRPRRIRGVWGVNRIWHVYELLWLLWRQRFEFIADGSIQHFLKHNYFPCFVFRKTFRNRISKEWLPRCSNKKQRHAKI